MHRKFGHEKVWLKMAQKMIFCFGRRSKKAEKKIQNISIFDDVRKKSNQCGMSRVRFIKRAARKFVNN
jgi:hypothetical protein